MLDFPEILSLKSILQTALSKIEAMEKKMNKKPSKRFIDREARIDNYVAKKRARILKNQL